MEFDIRKFDSYREDNRREVKKSEGWSASIAVGDIFIICKLLWWSNYSWCC